MKILKNVLGIGLLMVATAFASIEKEDDFKGNWSASFKLKEGTVVVHTPDCTIVGNSSSQKGISLQSKSYNGIPLSKKGLQLKTNSTQQEFVKALIESGLYESKD